MPTEPAHTDPFEDVLGTRRGDPTSPTSTPLARARELARRAPAPPAAGARSTTRQRFVQEVKRLASELDLRATPRSEKADAWLLFDGAEADVAFGLMSRELLSAAQPGWGLWVCAGSGS